MLGHDLAALYGVTTAALVQMVKRNPERFPEDFMFQLSDAEFDNLVSQVVTSSWDGHRKMDNVPSLGNTDCVTRPVGVGPTSIAIATLRAAEAFVIEATTQRIPRDRRMKNLERISCRQFAIVVNVAITVLVTVRGETYRTP